MLADPIRAALDEFCANIDATGGLTRGEEGLPVPCGDPEWLDMADTYLKACAALGRTPVWNFGAGDDAENEATAPR